MYLTIERRLTASNEEHIAILDALLKGDTAQAAQILEIHIGAFEKIQYFE